MQKTKRVVIATILGLICGCISWIVCKFGMGHDQSLQINLFMILANGLLGFTIGISCLRWHWALHGLALGGLFGFIIGLVASAMGSELLWPLLFGFVYGFLIELITTGVFKTGIGK